jgi:mRNA interferase MazF
MVQVTSRIRNDKLSHLINKNDFINGKELPLQSCIRLHKIFLLNENLIISKTTAVLPRVLVLVIKKIIELIK